MNDVNPATRRPTGSSATARTGRRWGRTGDTRRAVLDAALEVFLADGYAAAAVSDVVTRSGVSVGSIYHHFGGKAELFLALWDEFEDDYNHAATAAVAQARAGGLDDPVELFLVGARAWLETARDGSGTARLFWLDAGPPGFDTLNRRLAKSWIRKNTALLGLGDETVDRLRVFALTSIVAEGGRLICTLDDPAQAEPIIQAALDLARKVGR